MFYSTQKDGTMSDDTGSQVRRRRWRRMAGFLAIAAGIALLASGCGGGGTSAGSGASPSPASTYAKLIAYAQCMRSHGVPNFPDPNSNGEFNGNVINPHSPRCSQPRTTVKA
jgi:hypothetical protein